MSRIPCTCEKALAYSITVLLLSGLAVPFAGSGDAETGPRSLDGFDEASTGLPSNTEYVSVALGNFNGDNLLDIGSGVLSWLGGNDGLDAWTNSNGAQSWSKQSTGLSTDGGYGEVDAGDVNGDGHDDIVVPHESSWSGEGALGVRIYLSDGNTTPSWSEGNHPTTTGDFYSATFGDVDRDGNLDIGATTGSAGIKVWIGDGGSNWTEANTGLPSTGIYYGIEFGDFNGDNITDLVAGGGNTGIRAYAGDGGTIWTEDSSGLPSSSSYNGINLTDVNNDGNLDIVAGSWQLGMRVYTGDGGSGGSMSWTQESSGLPTSGFYSQIASGDVDMDGNIDVLGGEAYGGGVAFYLGDGGAGGSCDWTSFTSDIPSSGAYSGAAIADLDNDGDLDMVVSDSGRSQGGSIGIRVFLSDVFQFNRPPIPDAGEDQTVYIGDTVDLDASGSTDPDGSVSAFKWNFSDRPSGSSVALSDDTIMSPSFIPDEIGDYTITLAVGDNEGRWGLLEDMVNITVIPLPNKRPIADAGQDFSATIFTEVQLDGSGSSDEEGIVDYDWNITSHPSPADLNLSDETVINPVFTPRYIGKYKFTLTVKDVNETWSDDDEITVTVNPEGSGPPTADAGPDVTIELGNDFLLDGGNSTDDMEIEEYEWIVENEPAGSHMMLEQVEKQLVEPTEEGLYEISLMVRDNDNLWSEKADTMQIIVLPMNEPPVARITSPEDGEIFLSTDTIPFDGAASEDPEGLGLTYFWSSDIEGDLGTEDYFDTILTVGVHEINLTVIDDHDNRDSVVIEIEVRIDHIPMAFLSAYEDLILVGEKVVLSGGGCRDKEGEVMAYLYDYGDGTDSGWIGEKSTSKIYREPGIYQATLKVKDESEQVSNTSEPVEIIVGERPFASLSVPSQQIEIGETVGFNAGESTDPDGSVDRYKFIVEGLESGESESTGWVNGSVMERVFEEQGTYRVNLMVQDNHGFVSENSATVTVIVKAVEDNEPENDNLSGIMFPLLAIIIIAAVVAVLLVVLKKKKMGKVDQGDIEGQQQAGYDRGHYQDQGWQQAGGQGQQQAGYDRGHYQDQQQDGYDQG